MKNLLTNHKRGMKMLTPARDWREALPCGNGPIGALVYGCISPETILFNHEALWYEGHLAPLPDVSSNLSQVRSLLLNGDYEKANALYPQKLSEKGFNPILPKLHPAFDLKIMMPTKHAFSDYYRYLDFQTGEAKVVWKDGKNELQRRFFVSRTDNVAVMHIKANVANSINAAFQLCEHNLSDAIDEDGSYNKPKLTFQSVADGEWIELKVEGSNGGEYGAVLRVLSKSGELHSERDITWTDQLTSLPLIRGVKFEERGVVRCKNADEILVVIGFFVNQPAESAIPALRSKIMALAGDYDELFNRHAKVHREIFNRVEFKIDTKKDRDTANEHLLLQAYAGKSPEVLIEKMFDFGRHLLLSCSSPESMPPTLQGTWNGDHHPAWHSFYVNNENTQMFYWQALPGNMHETTHACFNYFESFLNDMRENARKLWNCRGICLTLVTANATGLLQDLQSHVINFVGCAGWIAQLYYDYWLFTRDRDFLKNKAVPFMKEVAQFYEDFIIVDKEGYNLFMPSNSPENAPRNSFPEGIDFARTMNPGIPTTINSTIDVAIAKEALSNLCEACQTLRIEKENVKKWRQMLSKMRPYRINEDGALAEWIPPDLLDNYAHRHLSHLYPAFPGFEITREKTPELFDACKVALAKRLEIGLASQTGWSLAHMANIYARLGYGDRALECLNILNRSCLGQNLFTYHNDWRNMGLTLKFILGRNAPYQVDANMGWTAAVFEMLVFSTPQLIKLLPALPKVWNRGKIAGVLTRCGIEVSLEWDRRKRTIDAVFKSKKTAGNTLIQFPAKVKVLKCNMPKAVEESPKGPAYRNLVLPANSEVKLRVKALEEFPIVLQ